MKMLHFASYEEGSIDITSDEDRPRSYDAYWQMISAFFFLKNRAGNDARITVKQTRKIKKKLFIVGQVVAKGTPSERRELKPEGGEIPFTDAEFTALVKMVDGYIPESPNFLCDAVDHLVEFLDLAKYSEEIGGVKEIKDSEFADWVKVHPEWDILTQLG